MSKDVEIIKKLKNRIGKVLPRLNLDEIMEETNGYTVIDEEIVIGLNLNHLKITDSSFINKLKNLTHLSLKEAEISDTSFLKVLTNLTHLVIIIQRTLDYSALRELKKLEHLSLKFEQVSDLHFLKELKKLKYLHLYSDNENITELNLSQLKIEEISLNGKLKNLNHLELDGNLISDLSFIEELKELSNLKLRNNRISDISSLKSLKKLTRLDLSENQISDTSIFQKMKNLTHLYLNTVNITDFSFLKDIENLSNISLMSNQIRDISFIKPLQKLKILKRIDLMNNEIEKLPESITDFEIEICHDKNFQPEKEGINFYGNPLKEPPVEIVQKGKESVDFFVRNKIQSMEDTFTGKKALRELKDKISQRDDNTIYSLLSKTSFSKNLQKGKQVLLKCIDELFEKIENKSGRREIRTCLEFLREKKFERTSERSEINEEFEIFNRLIYNNENSRFSDCIYKFWDRDSQKLFDEAYNVIFKWKDFFLSYTDKFASQTNKVFQGLLKDKYKKDFNQKKNDINFLAKLIADSFRGKFFELFYAEDCIKAGQKFGKKILKHCNSCFLFIQLIDSHTLVRPKKGDKNWCLFEYLKFKDWAKDTKFGDEDRYFFIVTNKDIIPGGELLKRMPIEYRNWIKEIVETEFVVAPKSMPSLDKFFDELAQRIDERINEIIENYLTGICN